jgi:hypothetical protein
MKAAKLKKEIKRDIIEQFRGIDEDEHLFVSQAWLLDDYAASLDTHSRKILEKAMNELVAKGLLAFSQEPQPGFQLTHKGVNLIF